MKHLRILRGLLSVLPLIAALVLSSCSAMDVFSVEPLIRAPKLTGEEGDIQKAFEDAVGNETLLVNPLSGKYRTAIVRVDYDLDEEIEALVFYASKNAPTEIRVLFLERSGSLLKMLPFS